MTLPDDDPSWKWVVEPEKIAKYNCENKDLGIAINAGKRICELRAKAGLTAQEVEDYAGVRKANLLAMEAGLLEVDAVTADSLAVAYGVNVAEITGC